MKEYNKQYIYKNFNRKNKWFGIIDYKSLVILILYIFCIMTLLRIINLSFEYSLYFFCFFVIPIIAVFFININNDVAVDVIVIVLKYYIKKVFFVRLEDKKGVKYFKYKKEK